MESAPRQMTEFEVACAFENSSHLPPETPQSGARSDSQTAGQHTDAFASGLLRLCGRDQHYGGLGGEKQEGKGFLQIELHRGVRVAGVADGDILANVQ